MLSTIIILPRGAINENSITGIYKTKNPSKNFFGWVFYLPENNKNGGVDMINTGQLYEQNTLKIERKIKDLFSLEFMFLGIGICIEIVTFLVIMYYYLYKYAM